MKSIIIIVILLFNYIFDYNNAFCDDDKKKTMFSSYIQDGKNNMNLLLVIYDKYVFIRKIDREKFIYYIPKDGCYKIEYGIDVCIENGLIYNIIGDFYNKNNNGIIDDKSDLFYTESNEDCNKMKFDIVYRFFIKNEKIKYAIYQLYMMNFLDVIRMVIFDDTTELNPENRIKSFVISGKNDIGCLKDNMYLIYNYNSNQNFENNKIKNKKKKNKKITKKQKQESVYNEFYDYIAIKNYKHLKPLDNMKDLENVVITTDKNLVKQINVVALDFVWKEQNGQFLLSNLDFLKKNVNKKK